MARAGITAVVVFVMLLVAVGHGTRSPSQSAARELPHLLAAVDALSRPAGEHAAEQARARAGSLDALAEAQLGLTGPLAESAARVESALRSIVPDQAAAADAVTSFDAAYRPEDATDADVRLRDAVHDVVAAFAARPTDSEPVINALADACALARRDAAVDTRIPCDDDPRERDVSEAMAVARLRLAEYSQHVVGADTFETRLDAYDHDRSPVVPALVWAAVSFALVVLWRHRGRPRPIATPHVTPDLAELESRWRKC